MRITQLGTVIVTVSDQDAAAAFYIENLGFEQLADFMYADGERWVEVAPPGSTARLALAARRSDNAGPTETGIAFGSTDVDADHAGLHARGVEVDPSILREGDAPVRWAGATLAGVPPMFRFRDPDGNSFLIVQALETNPTP